MHYYIYMHWQTLKKNSLHDSEVHLTIQSTYISWSMTWSIFSDPPTVRLSALPPQGNNVPVTLYCDVDRFYPEQVSVSWHQNGSVLPNPPTTDQNLDGTFRTRRYYTLSPAQREQGGTVECAVHQPGAAQPVTISEDLAKLDPRGKFWIGVVQQDSQLGKYSLCRMNNSDVVWRQFHQMQTHIFLFFVLHANVCGFGPFSRWATIAD